MKKQRILLLHGALGSKKQLDPIKDLLQDEYNVYHIDFEGHGLRASDKEYSIGLFTQNVLDFLDEMNIEKIDVFGYSMGGYVALNTALQAPERVNNIVTLGTKFDWSIESAQREIKMLQPDIIELKVPHFAQKLKEEHSSQDWKEVMHKTARMMLTMAEGHKLKQEDIEAITHKVTIGIGDSDKMVSLEESRHIASILQGGSLNVLKQVEHPIDKIEPSLVADYIKTFI